MLVIEKKTRNIDFVRLLIEKLPIILFAFLAVSACGGGGGGGAAPPASNSSSTATPSTPSSNPENWDEIRWDQDNWG